MNNQLRLSQPLFLSLPIDSFAALVSGMICLSLSPILIRFSELEIGPNATTFNRFWIAATVFGLLNTLSAVHRRRKQTPIPIQQEKPHLSPRRQLLIADGVFLSLGVISWTWSLTKTTIANASIIHDLIPVFTILSGWLFLSRTVDRRFLSGMCVAIAGAVLLEVNNLSSLSLDQIQGDLAAFVSSIFLGLHPLMVEQLRTQLSSLTIMIWSSAIGCLFLLPMTLLSETQLFPISLNGWLSVLALTIVVQILGIGLCAYSLKRISSSFTSIFALLVPVLSTVEGWVIFSENLTVLTMMSFVVILSGMYLAVSSKSAVKPEVESSTVE